MHEFLGALAIRAENGVLLDEVEWPAFVNTYRTLLADPPPELMRLFERLPEVMAAA
jgi:hypothetical protein